ncbi:MAG: hypothetical protein MUD10_01045 [Candidatus Pacebacteria bacterium]|jgi:hypothetical protein|nr:hypothetical protein [Candidatus Paceibacterota bacterium]
MQMIQAKIIFVAFFLAMVGPEIALAHLPYLEEGATEITVTEPEISKAYYGWLQGSPAVYTIDADKPFLLYLNLLSPRVENGKMDYSMDIYKDGEILQKIYGGDAIWMVEYEPFANDYYSKGPEYEAAAEPGDYRIEVYDSGNSGNYVLAVGKTEDLSLGQFFRTLAVLPKIKTVIFGKPALDAFNNYLGLAALVMLVAFLVIIYFLISFIRNKFLKKRLDHEYQSYRERR